MHNPEKTKLNALPVAELVRLRRCIRHRRVFYDDRRIQAIITSPRIVPLSIIAPYVLSSSGDDGKPAKIRKYSVRRRKWRKKKLIPSRKDEQNKEEHGEEHRQTSETSEKETAASDVDMDQPEIINGTAVQNLKIEYLGPEMVE